MRRLLFFFIGVLVYSFILMVLGVTGVEVPYVLHIIVFAASGVIIILMPAEKPLKEVDWKRLLTEATDLKEAVTLAFDDMPVNTSFIGPKGLLKFSRNSLPKGDPSVAEISVTRVNRDEDDKRILFTFYWGENYKTWKVREVSGKMSEWNDKW